jgi:hypothetical protein
MGKSSNFQIREESQRNKPLHPAWTAVGCFIVVAFMVLGYFIAEWFLTANETSRWIVMPVEFAWPDFAPFLIFKLVIGAMALLLGSALVSILFAIVNPPKPGKYDVKHPEEMTPIYNKRK